MIDPRLGKYQFDTSQVIKIEGHKEDQTRNCCICLNSSGRHGCFF